MLRKTPLKNSKNVNKPFRSPFDTVKRKSNLESIESPLSSRNAEAKKLIILDSKQKENLDSVQKKDEETSSYSESLDSRSADKKDPKSQHGVQNERSLAISEEPLKKRRKIQYEADENFRSTDLKQYPKNCLNKQKRRVFEKRQELDCLKSRILYAKKHDPETLRASIKKWKQACQNALEELCQELNERQGGNVPLKIFDVLKMLNIPENLVNYSIETDSFC